MGEGAAPSLLAFAAPAELESGCRSETQRFFTAMLSPNAIEEWIGGASDDQCATLAAAVERRKAQLKCAPAAQSRARYRLGPELRVRPVQVRLAGSGGGL